jgi:hypothetical protein
MYTPLLILSPYIVTANKEVKHYNDCVKTIRLQNAFRYVKSIWIAEVCQKSSTNNETNGFTGFNSTKTTSQ